jgi:hypothetical protein
MSVPVEKEEQIASMQRQIEDLRRKAEQGSQQLQGEVQELALEGLLRQKFPRDVFEACSAVAPARLVALNQYR